MEDDNLPLDWVKCHRLAEGEGAICTMKDWCYEIATGASHPRDDINVFTEPESPFELKKPLEEWLAAVILWDM